MNDILKNGYVSPYIHFQFENGMYIDTAPPRYFVSFKQTRSIKKACTFNLTIMYVPGNDGESDALLIHKLLLSNQNSRVVYEYGYKTPNGGIVTQSQQYTGIFTKYTETINDTYLTYNISGISQAVDESTPEVNITEYINNLTNDQRRIKPSGVIKEIISGAEGSDPKIKDFFSDFDISDIEETDQELGWNSYQALPKDNVSIHDLISGKSNPDGTTTITGIANLGVHELTAQFALSSGLLSAENVTGYNTLIAHGASSSASALLSAAAKGSNKERYAAYFDNVLTGGGSKGSFHYRAISGKDSGSNFHYNFGNNFLDSDVLSFSCDADWTVAIGSLPAFQSTRSSIDANGQNVGSNLIVNQKPNFNKTVYNTPSGFDTSAFLSSSTISKALNFPFNATMTVIGQIQCNQLMDRINVEVCVNGVNHPALSGTYVIQSVEDELSESGFTTTFGMYKLTDSSSDNLPPVYSVGGEGSNASKNEDAFKDDYKR